MFNHIETLPKYYPILFVLIELKYNSCKQSLKIAKNSDTAKCLHAFSENN